MKTKHRILSIAFAVLVLFGFKGISLPAVLHENNQYVSANASTKEIIPGGKTIGITLSTEGVVVVELTKVINKNGTEVSPAKDAGILPGDMIISIDNQPVSDVEELNTILGSTPKAVNIAIKRNEKLISTTIEPVISDDNTLKIGAWVKDAASGIGTITFIDPQTGSFGALGHEICDSESQKALLIDGGMVYDSTIVSVTKSTKGNPGELKGSFSESNQCIGKIFRNNSNGLYGIIADDTVCNQQTLPMAYKHQITEGPATILSNISGETVKEFNIEILKVFPNAECEKNMIIKVTDKNLIEKTGGIVQGMSGSPIIQNGKIVGAVTHLFVNDPTRGYGIFIENMLAEAEKLK